MKNSVKEFIKKELIKCIFREEIEIRKKDREKSIDASMLNDVESDPGFGMAGEEGYYEPDPDNPVDGKIDSTGQNVQHASSYGQPMGTLFGKEKVSIFGPRPVGPTRGSGFGNPTGNY